MTMTCALLRIQLHSSSRLVNFPPRPWDFFHLTIFWSSDHCVFCCDHQLDQDQDMNCQKWDLWAGKGLWGGFHHTAARAHHLSLPGHQQAVYEDVDDRNEWYMHHKCSLTPWEKSPERWQGAKSIGRNAGLASAAVRSTYRCRADCTGEDAFDASDCNQIFWIANSIILYKAANMYEICFYFPRGNKTWMLERKPGWSPVKWVPGGGHLKASADRSSPDEGRGRLWIHLNGKTSQTCIDFFFTIFT